LIIKGVLLSKLGRADEAKQCTEKVLEIKKEPEKTKPEPVNPPRYYFQKDSTATQNSNK
jgi:hypothetical protein